MRTSVVLLFIAVGIPFVAGWFGSNASTTRRDGFRALLRSRTETLLRSAETFDSLCVALHDTSGVSTVRNGYERLRMAYKAIEPLADYLDPSLVSQHINGAPLPRLDVKSQFVDILEPSGLQVIDEVLHATDAEVIANVSRLRALTSSLNASLVELAALVDNTPWTDRMILEACRSGIMRVTAMGITGFDRPASEPSAADDVAPLSTIRAIMALYAPACRQRDAGVLAQRLDAALERAIERCSSSSFDDLSRVDIIRDCLDPAYGLIADIHTTLEIEDATEIGPQPVIVNPRARSMFVSDVLYASAASGMRQQDITPELVELGRTLFFDPILSATNDRSCASCHNPELAFTDGQARSVALGRTGTLTRNAPTLVNAALARRFFHDMRAMRISDVIAHVVTNEHEFNSRLIDVVGRLRTSDEYTALFARAFRVPNAAAIDAPNIGIAISAYLTTLVTFNSRIDRYLRGEHVSITDAERRGFDLFMGKGACATCHFPPTFAGYVPPAFTESESEIIGVPLRPAIAHAVADPDPGRAGGIVRENAIIYRGSFKTPTVRNIALTAPYFHNGAYDRLEDVVDLYVRGGGAGIGLDVPYQTLPFTKLELTERDQRDLVAFMEALTDTVGLTRRPTRLPRSSVPALNTRVVGGLY